MNLLMRSSCDFAKQMTLNVEVSFDAFGKELGLFWVCFGSLVT